VVKVVGVPSVARIAAMICRDPSMGPRTATAFARYVRHNPLSGMAVVKASTVQSYCTSIARHLITRFPAENLFDWRLIPNSPYRDTTYNAYLKGLANRDPMRELRLPFGLRFLRASAARDKMDGKWAASAPLFNWSGIASYFGLRGSEFLDTPHSRRRRGGRGLLAILCNDVAFLDAAGRRLAWPFARHLARRVVLTFTWHKNGMNGQQRELLRNGDDILCPVDLFFDIVEHFFRVTPSGDTNLPLAVNQYGRHITSAVMDAYVKRAVRAFHPSITAIELRRYTVHSFRIGALERLLNQHHMKVALAAEFLRWRSEAYILYIRTASYNFSKLSPSDEASIQSDFVADASYVSDDDSDDE